MSRTAVWLAVATLATLGASAQEAVQRDEWPDGRMKSAADAALRTFRRLVDASDYKAMGFATADEVGRARLGAPLEEVMVRLDELQKVERGQDVGPLLHRTGRITVPVLVEEQTRSSIVLALEGERWTPVSYGAPRYARALDELRRELAKAQGRRPGSYFEVRVPALNVSFVGSREGGRAFLTPLADDARFGFKRGVTTPADEALGAMVPAAREHNGLPT